MIIFYTKLTEERKKSVEQILSDRLKELGLQEKDYRITIGNDSNFGNNYVLKGLPVKAGDIDYVIFKRFGSRYMMHKFLDNY